LAATEREHVERNLKIVFRTVMELMKAIADHDPRDTERVAMVNSAWADIFGGWQPEYDREEEWPGLSAEEIARRQQHNAAVEILVNSKAELEDLRGAYRFSLAYWALHRLEKTADIAWADVLKQFVPWLGSVEKMAEQTDQVVQIDYDTRLFLWWHDGDVQMAWAAPRAFLVFALLQHAPEHIPADIGLPQFLHGTMSTEIEKMLDAVASDQKLWGLLGGAPTDIAQRVKALRGMIRTAGESARVELGLA
jgi:hypothetical protein